MALSTLLALGEVACAVGVNSDVIDQLCCLLRVAWAAGALLTTAAAAAVLPGQKATQSPSSEGTAEGATPETQTALDSGNLGSIHAPLRHVWGDAQPREDVTKETVPPQRKSTPACTVA